MPAGLQVWNASGILLLDATHRIGRFKGIARVGPGNGSLPLDLSDGTPCYSFQPDFFWKHIANETPPPIFTIGPTGISWTYSSTSGLSYPNPIIGTVIVGVF